MATRKEREFALLKVLAENGAMKRSEALRKINDILPETDYILSLRAAKNLILWGYVVASGDNVKDPILEITEAGRKRLAEFEGKKEDEKGEENVVNTEQSQAV